MLFNENKEAIGFSVKTPLNKCDDIIQVVDENISDIDPYFFGSDLGIAPAYRKMGLSFYLERLQTSRLSKSFNSEITRTSAKNYKRTAGNLKGGKNRLPFVEEVTMKRTDGSVKSDKRIYFERALNFDKSPDLQLQRVVIASPGGNHTAIVFDHVNEENYGELSKMIQSNYPGVEQVMYVEEGKAVNLRALWPAGSFVAMQPDRWLIF